MTPQELNAGISRGALEIQQRRLRQKTVSEIISGYRSTRVIDTPMRLLDVLESNEGEVILRSTEYTGDRVAVTRMHLSYAEAQSLCSILRDLEPAEEFGAPKNGKVCP